MKWSQAVCASILVDGLLPPVVKLTRAAERGTGRFQEPYLLFGTYAPDDRFSARPDAGIEPASPADSHRV
jgi:hypothetical protein